MPIPVKDPSEKNTEYGVSFTSHNPEPEEYVAVQDAETAVRICDLIGKLRCPHCGEVRGMNDRPVQER